jgi:signal transduction protein with GAF and PtsI domain
MPVDRTALLADLERTLAGEAEPWSQVLDLLLQRFGCTLGTVHLLDNDGVTLRLHAHRNLPPPVQQIVASVPVGKGMAGIAAERREPVQVCNLQRDSSGVVRPGAKLTQMEGSIAVPMLEGRTLRGVFGIAKPVAYEFTADESAALLAVGARLARAR